MELISSEMENFDNEKYERAKKRVKEIKGFYSHLTVYLVINSILIFLRLGILENGLSHLEIPSWSILTTPLFWGIGLLAHAILVFHHKVEFLKNWESRKIKEYMEKDESEFKKTNRNRSD